MGRVVKTNCWAQKEVSLQNRCRWRDLEVGAEVGRRWQKFESSQIGSALWDPQSAELAIEGVKANHATV